MKQTSKILGLSLALPGLLAVLLNGQDAAAVGRDLDASSFAPRVNFLSERDPSLLAIGDLDGDGRPDLAVANEYSTSVSLLRNASGPGIITPASFEPRIDLPVAGRAFFVSLGDLDGDGKPEAVVAHDGGLSFDADGVTRLPVGPSYSVQLYAGPSADSLQPVGAAVHIAPVPGRFVGGARTIPTVAPLQTATVQVRAWESAAGGSFEEARAAGGKTGVSPLLQVITGGGGVPPRPPATLTGLQSFSLTGSIERTLSIVSPPNRNVGEVVEVPVQLASSGDVGGMTFLLRYDPDYLSVPEVSWDATLAGALRQANIPSLGQIRMVFALPATTVPGGVQTLATVSFRARTVPADATTALRLQIVDAALPTGEPILHGTGVLPGTATIFAGRNALPGLLGNLRRLLSGECHLTLSGDAGATHRIEASHDLVHWTTLTTVVNSTGSMPFVDPEAAHHPKRFYRTQPVE